MTRKLIILSGLLFLIGLIALVGNTVLFIRAAFPEAAFPVAEFDANVPREFVIEDTDYRYIVYALVDSHESTAPEAIVSLLAADGTRIDTDPTQGYADLIGRYYKRLARFEVSQPGTLTITVGSGPTEDFAIFRDINDVLDRRTANAMPVWVVSAVLIVLSIGLLIVAMLKSEKDLDRHISGVHQ